MVASAPASAWSSATSRSSYSSSPISAPMKAPAIAPPVRCRPLLSLAIQPERSAAACSTSVAGAAAGDVATEGGDGAMVAGPTVATDGGGETAFGGDSAVVVTAGALGAAEIGFLPKNSSPTSAFSQSSL